MYKDGRAIHFVEADEDGASRFGGDIKAAIRNRCDERVLVELVRVLASSHPICAPTGCRRVIDLIESLGTALLPAWIPQHQSITAITGGLADKSDAAARIPHICNTEGPQWSAFLDAIADSPEDRDKIIAVLSARPANSSEVLAEGSELGYRKFGREACTPVSFTLDND